MSETKIYDVSFPFPEHAYLTLCEDCLDAEVEARGVEPLVQDEAKKCDGCEVCGVMVDVSDAEPMLLVRARFEGFPDEILVCEGCLAAGLDIHGGAILNGGWLAAAPGQFCEVCEEGPESVKTRPIRSVHLIAGHQSHRPGTDVIFHRHPGGDPARYRKCSQASMDRLGRVLQRFKPELSHTDLVGYYRLRFQIIE